MVLSGNIPPGLENTVALAKNQHSLAARVRTLFLHHQIVRQIVDKSPPDKARISHLQKIVLSGSDPRLPGDPQKVISFSPTSFLTRSHPHSISSYSLSNFVKLLFGLPIPTLQPVCRCSNPFTSDGAHQLNCKRWAARGWTPGHDLVVAAILEETNLAGVRARGEAALLDQLRQGIPQPIPSHATSKKRADALVYGDDDL